MAKTSKDNQYNSTTFERSAWYERWCQREAKLKEQQASCMHSRYTVFGSPMGEYAVCLHCDKNLGYLSDVNTEFHNKVVLKGVANA